MELKAYKLTASGEALLQAAKDQDKPHKGIVETAARKNGKPVPGEIVRVNLKTLTDETAALIEHTQYVEKVLSAPKVGKGGASSES